MVQPAVVLLRHDGGKYADPIRPGADLLFLGVRLDRPAVGGPQGNNVLHRLLHDSLDIRSDRYGYLVDVEYRCKYERGWFGDYFRLFIR